MTQLYTTSRLRVLRDCIQRHYYQYVLNIRTPSSWQAEFGTTGHGALEAYLRAWMANAEPGARLSAAVTYINRSKHSDVEKAKLRVLIAAYSLRWGARNWTILAVEKEFRFELDDALIGGKIDAIIQDNDTGLVYVLEHKFTGSDTSPGSAYWEKLAIDSQVSIYTDGATILGHRVAGCIYDVIKRPEHELLTATPEEKREYTIGKGCKGCGGSAKAGEIKQGLGYYTAAFGTDIKKIDCADCKGTGWKCDAKTGVPEAPRLYSRFRDHDETIEEFEDRLIEAIGNEPDGFLQREIVVRLDSELETMRDQLLKSIALERVTSATKLYVRNTDACARYGGMCSFFGACSGRADIDDETLFPRAERAHPELASAA